MPCFFSSSTSVISSSVPTPPTSTTSASPCASSSAFRVGRSGMVTSSSAPSYALCRRNSTEIPTSRPPAALTPSASSPISPACEPPHTRVCPASPSSRANSAAGAVYLASRELAEQKTVMFIVLPVLPPARAPGSNGLEQQSPVRERGQQHSGARPGPEPAPQVGGLQRRPDGDRRRRQHRQAPAHHRGHAPEDPHPQQPHQDGRGDGDRPHRLEDVV